MNSNPSQCPTIDESARLRFEAAWRDGGPREIEPHLPAQTDPRFLATLEELVCIDLEFAWKAAGKAGTPGGSRSRRVEDYLVRFPQLNAPEIVARLVREEFFVRQRHGDHPSTAEYRDRFPFLSTVVAELETHEARSKSPEDRPPVTDGYRVVGVLGKGGMGVVYEAHETQLGRVVALKTSRVGTGAAETEMRARFLAEARVAARLEHPGVVPVHELVTPPNGEPFYTMKLVRGRTLADAIHEFHTQPQGVELGVARRRLLDGFLAVTLTMAFAHEKGVIHRDLKPANVVLGEYGETVILDWGLAKVLRGDGTDAAMDSEAALPEPELTAHGKVMGTPAYMAPEQAGGLTAEIDERSDIYALGAILYHILTGTHPHRGATNILRSIQEREPARPSTIVGRVPRPLEAICLKAMAKRKDDRFPSAKALAADVERFLAGEPVSVYRERTHERLTRWARRHRTIVAAGIVALVLSIVGCAVGLYLHESAAHDRREQAIEFDNRQEQQRQLQAFELERQQTRQRTEKREAVVRAAQNELARGLVELKTGRFSDAEQTFRKGLAEIPTGEDFEVRSQLSELHRGAARLAAFSRYREWADRLALGTDDIGWTVRDEAVIAACEAGLRNLGVIDGPPDWWNHLPDGELPDPLRHRVREDVAASLGLLAMWRTKRGFVRKLWKNDEGSQADYRAAVDLLGRVQGFVRADTRRRAPTGERGSPAAAALEFFCRMRLGESPTPPRLPLIAEDAPDLYFLGIAHLFIDFTPQTGVSLVDKARFSLLGDFTKLSGLDFDSPLIAAERQLRQAVALDPGYHMANYWLGRCLRRAGDYSAAEQAFNACIALRPRDVPAYTGRARTLLAEAKNAKNSKPPRMPAELRAAALRGLETAPESVRADPEVRWLEAVCLDWLGHENDAIAAAANALEKEIVQRYAIESGLQSVASEVVPFLEGRAKNHPDQLESHAALAVASFVGGPETTARAEVEWVLARAPNNPRTRALRGMMRLRAGAIADALSDFDAALAAAPLNEVAGAGRAWALEQLGQWDAALKAHSRLLPTGTVGTGPQHLQPYLGQARVLVKLGRTEDARKALDAAREIDPVATEALATKLFPRASSP